MTPHETPDYSRQAPWRVLLAMNAFFVLFGISTAWFASIPPSSLWSQWIAEHFYQGTMPQDARTMYDFMRGPLGGTMAGSYLLQTWIVAVPLRRGEPWAWWAIASATVVWFVVDSAVSIAHDAWFNVFYINTFALLSMFAVLIWFWISTPFALMRR